MARFRRIREIGYIPSPTLGKTSTLVIPRQFRRLETIIIHANVTFSGTTTATANQDKLEALFSSVRLKVSDAAGSSRNAINCPSAELIQWHRLNVGSVGRYNMQSMLLNANGTYDLFVPIHLRHPLMGDIVGNRTSLPLDSAFQNEDPRLELDIVAAGTDLGFSAATMALNYIRYQLIYREIPASAIYVPTELSTKPIIWASAGAVSGEEVPRGGFLSQIQLSQFTDATLKTRGSALTSAQNDYFKLFYGRTDIDTFYTAAQQEQDDWWSENISAGIAFASAQVPNPSGLVSCDFLHDRAHESGADPSSCVNLWVDNAGDTLKLAASAVTSNSGVKMTTHKFMVKNLALVAGQ